MSHNTPLENAEFKLTFAQTNLRWLLGETPINETKIERTRQAIEETKREIEKLKGCAQ